MVVTDEMFVELNEQALTNEAVLVEGGARFVPVDLGGKEAIAVYQYRFGHIASFLPVGADPVRWY